MNGTTPAVVKKTTPEVKSKGWPTTMEDDTNIAHAEKMLDDAQARLEEEMKTAEVSVPNHLAHSLTHDARQIFQQPDNRGG